MKILDRYIGRAVLFQTGVVLAVLIALYFFSNLVGELDYVGRGHYTLPVALGYCAMLLPREAYQLFPMVALLGGMLGLGGLASSNELTIVRAAGVSVRRIMFAVMKTALLLVLLVAIVGEFVAPRLEQAARIMRARAMSQNISVNAQEGLWARDGDTYVNIERLLPDDVARGVMLYVFNDQHRLLQMVSARQAIYQAGSWVLQHATKSVLHDDSVTTADVAEERWHTDLKPEVLNVVALPPDKLSVQELAGYVAYTRANGLDGSIYALYLWTRIFAPLATAGMMLLAVPFIFGSLRSVGIGLRITVGGLLGIGFYLFNAVFGRVALVYHLSPFLGAVLPTLMVFGLWWLLMRRVQ